MMQIAVPQYTDPDRRLPDDAYTGRNGVAPN